MNEQSKGIRMIYAVFMIAVTVRAIVSLHDRFYPKEKNCECKKCTAKWQ